LIWSSYPVATRAGLASSATPDDLVLMRFGIGALCFLPYLILRHRSLPSHAWRAGVPLALYQGAGMAALVIFGLKHAPAAHAAALGPGASHAWIAILGLLVFSRMPLARHAVGSTITLAGVLMLVSLGGTKLTANVIVGDAMFLAASALGAMYVLQTRACGITPFHGALLVTAYSAAVVVPWHALFAVSAIPRMSAPEFAWHALWQGVLIGFVSLVSMNHAIARLGSERACAMFALVPVLGAALGYLFLGEALSLTECMAVLAISAGVAVATVPVRRLRAMTA
jgi:drug/metabolite transporter (DMT)-like permease